MGTDDPVLQDKIIRTCMHAIADMDYNNTPPHIGAAINDVVRSLVGEIDPYRDLKDLYNRLALEFYPEMKQLVADSPDPLLTAARLAIAGNNIDFGIRARTETISLRDVIDETLAQPFGIDHYEAFSRAVRESGKVIYAADNAGEIVFDRVLIEEIPDFRNRVTLVVRGGPVLNDVTREDAREAGLEDKVRVIDTGHIAPGILFDRCSPEFMEEFRSAGLVIAKGQGNYETVTEYEGRAFFLLRAKCPVIARNLDVETGDIVLKSSQPAVPVM
jgi:hypothetical protein